MNHGFDIAVLPLGQGTASGHNLHIVSDKLLCVHIKKKWTCFNHASRLFLTSMNRYLRVYIL